MLAQYGQRQPLYEEFASALGTLLVQILRDRGIALHAITHRAKEPDSLLRKLSNPGRSYGALEQVTDLAGVRVITYFHDDVDRAAEILKSEFTIDAANSIDMRARLDPDRFGYLSLHFVVSLSPARSQLPEYRRFTGLPAELQIRSLLQHAWAEIEHDLGYKSAQSVPSPIRRRFSRLAGMLELADAEFAAIRDASANYQDQVIKQIADAPATVPIDRISLEAYAKTSQLLQSLDSTIASFAGASLGGPDAAFVDPALKVLYFHGIGTIAELDEALRAHKAEVAAFAKSWLTSVRYSILSRGISLFYLGYVLIAKSGQRENIANYFGRLRIGPPEALAELSDRVMQTAREAKII